MIEHVILLPALACLFVLLGAAHIPLYYLAHAFPSTRPGAGPIIDRGLRLAYIGAGLMVGNVALFVAVPSVLGFA